MISYNIYNIIYLLINKDYSNPTTYLNLRLLCKDSLYICNSYKLRYNCHLLNHLLIEKLNFDKNDISLFSDCKDLYTEIIYWSSNMLFQHNLNFEINISKKYDLLNYDKFNPLKNIKPVLRSRILKQYKHIKNNCLYELLYEPRLTKYIKGYYFYDL